MKEDLAENYSIRKWLSCMPPETKKGMKRIPLAFIAGGLGYLGLGFVFGGFDYEPEYLIEFIKGGLIVTVASFAVIPFSKNKEKEPTETNRNKIQNQHARTGANQ